MFCVMKKAGILTLTCIIVSGRDLHALMGLIFISLYCSFYQRGLVQDSNEEPNELACKFCKQIDLKTTRMPLTQDTTYSSLVYKASNRAYKYLSFKNIQSIHGQYINMQSVYSQSIASHSFINGPQMNFFCQVH